MVGMTFFAALSTIIISGVMGCWLLVLGVSQCPNVGQLFRYGSQPISDLDDSRGPVKIQGQAVEGSDGTVTAPFSGSSCLLYTYKVEEGYNSSGSSYAAGRWTTVDEGMDGVELIVDDGTGRVHVDPTGAEVSVEGISKTIKPGEELPERLAEHVAQTPNLEPQDDSVLNRLTGVGGEPQRFTERRLDVGDDVTVYGQVTRRHTAGPTRDMVVGDGDATPMFVISNIGAVRTAWHLARRELAYIIGGLLFLVFAIAGTLMTVFILS